LPKQIAVTARKAGFANRSYSPFLEPGGHAIPSDHTIDMERGVTIGGVVRSHDGKAVAGAEVTIMARAGADTSPDWSYVPEGTLTVTAQAPSRAPEMADVIVAPGMNPVELRLGPGHLVRGRVVNRQGKPLDGANPRVVTGKDGRFSFPAQTEPFRVFVDHESGFAEADEKTLADSPQLTIKPWGRIEGLVKIGARPAAGVQIRLSETDNRWAPNEAMPITQSQQLKTDARGRYAFDRVIPARLGVSRIFTLERSSFHVGTGAVQVVSVKPGQTSWADLGCNGRPVVGRFTIPTGIKAGGFFPSYGQFLERIRQEPPYPENLTGEERQKWLTNWLATAEGQAYSDSELVLDTNVRPDSHFRIEDVPAGKYQLLAELREPGTGVPGTFGPELASIDTEIIVPEFLGGRSDEPLDVGTIELKPIQR